MPVETLMQADQSAYDMASEIAKSLEESGATWAVDPSAPDEPGDIVGLWISRPILRRFLAQYGPAHASSRRIAHEP